MSQEEFFATVVQVLNELNISYMLVGSVASSFYGEPRSTHDIDFVMAILPPDVERLAESFEKPRYYLSEEAIREAVARGNPFNLIDSHTGSKADFWPLKSDPYHQTCFNRRKKQKIFENDKVHHNGITGTVIYDAPEFVVQDGDDQWNLNCQWEVVE